MWKEIVSEKEDIFEYSDRQGRWEGSNGGGGYMCTYSRFLEEGMATHFSILACRIPWTEEPGGLQSIVSQRAGQH